MTSRMFMPYVIGAAFAWLIALNALDTQAAVTYDTRVLTGEQAPGTDPGVVYSVLSTPVINGVGQTAFTATVSGPGTTTTNNEGLWSEGSGSLSLIAREGFAAPGTAAGVVFNTLSLPALNDTGQVAFRGTVTGTGVGGSNNLGIWSEGSGSLSLVARKGDAAADTAAGVTFAGLDGSIIVLNDAGQTAFEGRLTGPGVVGFVNDRGIWSEGSGSLSLAARGGSQAPGTDPGVVFGSYLFTSVINGVGQTAFMAGLAGTGVDTTNNGGIWSEGSGALSLVARSGDQAPGTDPGVVYTGPFGFNPPVINDAGQTAFQGFLTGTGVDTTNDTGIWSEGSGSLSLVAREGEQAPGTDPGVVFGNISSPQINGAGRTTFFGFLTGTGVDSSNRRGVWSEVSGSLSLIARTGDQLPGTDPGVGFGGTGSLGIVANNAGQIVVFGNTINTIAGGSGYGIWATDLNGVLTLIVQTGDLFDVNDDPLIDDFRTINLVRIGGGSGGEDGRSRSFNDAGQLVFRLRFTDNSEGIFVASLTPALAGDLNGDGFVGIDDLNIVLVNWNQNVPPGDPQADPSGDGFVGVDDLNVVLVNWNNGTPPVNGTAIPEPASMTMFAAGATLILRRRHRLV